MGICVWDLRCLLFIGCGVRVFRRIYFMGIEFFGYYGGFSRYLYFFLGWGRGAYGGWSRLG